MWVEHVLCIFVVFAVIYLCANGQNITCNADKLSMPWIKDGRLHCMCWEQFCDFRDFWIDPLDCNFGQISSATVSTSGWFVSTFVVKNGF